MKRSFPRRSLGLFLLVALIAVPLPSSQAADRLVIGNVSRTLEQLPNYAASDKGFFTEEGASLKIIGGTVPRAAYSLVSCPKYKTIPELKGTTIGVVSDGSTMAT